MPGEGGGRVIPYIGYLGVCGAKESGYVFLEEATSSLLGDKTISLWVLGRVHSLTVQFCTVLYPA